MATSTTQPPAKTSRPGLERDDNLPAVFAALIRFMGSNVFLLLLGGIFAVGAVVSLQERLPIRNAALLLEPIVFMLGALGVVTRATANYSRENHPGLHMSLRRTSQSCLALIALDFVVEFLYYVVR